MGLLGKIAKIGGTAVGAYLGGPIGAKIGSKLGGAVGGAVDKKKKAAVPASGMAVAAGTAGSAGVQPAVNGPSLVNEQAQIGRDALDWSKQIYADQAPDRLGAARRDQTIADSQVGQMNFANDQARELDAYSKTTFRPVEASLVQDAQTFDSPERRMAAASAAAADVNMSTDSARRAADRALGRSGVMPGTAKAMALQQDMATAQGRAVGGAMTGATRFTEQQGHTRMQDAAALGRGLLPIQAGQQSLAAGAGNAAVASGNSALGATMAGNAGVQQGFNTAQQGIGGAGNLFNSQAQIANQTTQTKLNKKGQTMDAIGGIASTLAKNVNWGKTADFVGSLFSDINVKSGTGKMLSGEKAVRQIEATPVHEGWEYDPAKGGPDDGGMPHDGPMAQDVQRNMGDDVAPGGKVIDIVSMNGRMMAAIQQLSKEVKALKRPTQTARAA